VANQTKVLRTSERRRRRRQLRRWGQGLYVLGAVVLVAGLAFVLRDDSPPGESVSADAPATTGLKSATSSTLPTAVTVAAPAGAAVTSPPSGGNTAPDITAPRTLRIPQSGAAAITGVSVADAQAKATDTFGVLVFSKDGRITLGNTLGLRLLAANGSKWLPFAGPLDAVNAALANLSYTPETTGGTKTLTIFVSDGGHQRKYPVLVGRRAISLVQPS
jgi:hypothetical protein